MENKQLFTNAEISRMVKLRLGGWHPKEIHDMMPNRTVASINRILSIQKKLNGYIYPTFTPHNAKWIGDKLDALAREWPVKTYKQIAEEKGLSTPRVCVLMARRAERIQMGYRG